MARFYPMNAFIHSYLLIKYDFHTQLRYICFHIGGLNGIISVIFNYFYYIYILSIDTA